MSQTAPTYRDGSGYDAADAHLAQADDVMADLVRRLGPIEFPDVEAPQGPLGSLMMAIVRQQLSNESASRIYGRLRDYFGGRTPTAEQLLNADSEMREIAGLSHAKDRALRALAARVASGELPLDELPSLPDEEVLRLLTAVPGIGPWTAGVFLMFRLGRPDVLLAGDLGIRKAAQVLYGLDGLPSPQALQAIAEPWRPHRTRACLYLWASVRG